MTPLQKLADAVRDSTVTSYRVLSGGSCYGGYLLTLDQCRQQIKMHGLTEYKIVATLEIDDVVEDIS